MYAPRDRSRGHGSESEGHSMSSSQSTGNQPLILRQADSSAVAANEPVSPETPASERNTGIAIMGPALPAMSQPAMVQIPSTGPSVTISTPPPPPPPPHDRPRPILERASTTPRIQRPIATRSQTRPFSDTMSTERVTIDESVPVSPSGRELNLGNGVQRYPVPTTGRESGLYLSELERRQTMPRQNSMVDYMVPTVRGSEHPSLPKSVEDRLKDTIANADREEKKYARKAKFTGYALNAAIGLQVLISAMITALSAVTSGKRTQVMTSVLGGAGTVVASYLARSRGSNEPELSITRVKDLQKFHRECVAFVEDHGEDRSNNPELNRRINDLRTSLEHLLGNGDGERKLSSV